MNEKTPICRHLKLINKLDVEQIAPLSQLIAHHPFENVLHWIYILASSNLIYSTIFTSKLFIRIIWSYCRSYYNLEAIYLPKGLMGH